MEINALKAGYGTAIANAEKKLAQLNPETVAARTGALWDGQDYIIPWFNELLPLSSGAVTEKILWLHYLTSEGTRPPVGVYAAYREMPGALFYEPAFNKRALNPLIKRFGGDPDSLMEAGIANGGRAADVGDVSVTLAPLPHLPVTYCIWRGDDETGHGGGILFDQTASGWLPAEDLAVLASAGVYRMMKYKKL